MTNTNSLNPIINTLVTAANQLNIQTGLNITPLVVPPFVDAQLYADLPNPNAINPVINQIVQFVNQIVNYTKPDITALATQLGYTPQQLNQYFNNPLNSTGIPNLIPNPITPDKLQKNIKKHYTIPIAPTNLQGTVNGTEIDLSWTNNATNQQGFKIYKSINGITYSLLTTTSNTSYADTGLAAGTYYYYVTAYNNQGESNPSNVVRKEVIMSAPTNLVGTITGTYNDEINLTWTFSGDINNIGGFWLYRNGTRNHYFSVTNGR